MSEKDRLVLAAILESIEKVRIFSGGFTGVDEFTRMHDPSTRC